MPYCPDCGIETIGKFCTECGQEVPTRRTFRARSRPPPPPPPQPPPQQSYYQQPTYSPPAQYPKRRSKSQDLLIAFIIILIFAIIIGIFVFPYLLFNDPSEIDVQVKNESGNGVRIYVEIDGEDYGSTFLSSGEEEWFNTGYSNDEEHTIEVYHYYMLIKYYNEIETSSDVRFTIEPDLMIVVAEI